MGCKVSSFNKLSSNHWLNVIIDLFFGDTSVYKSEVITLFKLSSKSEIITESKLTFPIVYLFLSFSNCFSLSTKSEFSTLFISSAKFCFLIL